MKRIKRLLHIAALFEWVSTIVVATLLVYIMQLLNPKLFIALGEESTPFVMIGEFVLLIIVAIVVYSRGAIHWMMWAFRQEDVDYFLLLSQAKSQGYYPRSNDKLIRFFATASEIERLDQILSVTSSPLGDKTIQELHLPIVYYSSPVFRLTLRAIWLGLLGLVLWLSIRDGMWLIAGLCVLAMLWVLHSVRRTLTENKLSLVIDMKGITLGDQHFEWQEVLDTRAIAESNRASVEFDVAEGTISIPSLLLFNKDCWELLAEIEMVRSLAVKNVS